MVCFPFTKRLFNWLLRWKVIIFFTEEIKNFAKERKGIFVRIEPYCSENNSILESLKSLGYANLNQKHIAFTLDLDGKDENELLDTIDVKAKDIIKNNENIILK